MTTQVAQDSAFLRLSSQDLDVGSKNAGCVRFMEGCNYLFLEQMCVRIDFKEEGSTLVHGFRGFGQ